MKLFEHSRARKVIGHVSKLFREGKNASTHRRRLGKRHYCNYHYEYIFGGGGVADV